MNYPYGCWNTVILLKGESRMTENEYKKFSPGDTIWGEDENPVELKRWPIAQDAQAMAELSRYKCRYRRLERLHEAVEYALEYCNTDSEGEFISGSDFEMAGTEEAED